MTERQAPSDVPFLQQFAAKRPPLAAVLMTVLIDIGMPRGGALTTAGLQKLLGALGYAPGAVRTALSRAVANELLVQTRTPDGRAAYGLSTPARIQAGKQVRTIYAAGPVMPTTHWLTVIVEKPTTSEHAALIEGGFTQVQTGLYVTAQMGIFPQEVIPPRAVIVRGSVQLPAAAIHRLHPRKMAQGFAALDADIDELLASSDNLTSLDPQDVAAIRVAALHRWRDLILDYPVLPNRATPASWTPEQAREAMILLYSLVADVSDHFLDQDVEIAGQKRATRIRDRFHVT